MKSLHQRLRSPLTISHLYDHNKYFQHMLHYGSSVCCQHANDVVFHSKRRWHVNIKDSNMLLCLQNSEKWNSASSFKFCHFSPLYRYTQTLIDRWHQAHMFYFIYRIPTLTASIEHSCNVMTPASYSILGIPDSKSALRDGSNSLLKGHVNDVLKK